MDIKSNLQQIGAQLPARTQLIAVSKYHSNEAIMEAYQAGQRLFGENKVQEMTQKYESLPKDIQWHLIGHLQSNKIKYIVPYVSMIHSVDSYKLLNEINKQAAKCGRRIPCLLQIHIAQEESKFGFSYEECRKMLEQGEWKNLENISISGLMGMATNTGNTKKIECEFHALRLFFDELEQSYFTDYPYFKELSMGMSHDFHLAVAQGSTFVRVGSKIFGERIY